MGGEGALAAWRHRGVTRRALGSPPAAEAQCKPYYSDYSRFRFLIHQMCTSHYLDLFITGVIGLNVITMAMEHYQQPKVSVLWLVDVIQGASALWSGALLTMPVPGLEVSILSLPSGRIHPYGWGLLHLCPLVRCEVTALAVGLGEHLFR